MLQFMEPTRDLKLFTSINTTQVFMDYCRVFIHEGQVCHVLCSHVISINYGRKFSSPKKLSIHIHVKQYFLTGCRNNAK